MSAKTELCTAVTLHAARVRELLADLRAAKIDSREWQDAAAALEARAGILANRADELAALCKKEGTTP